MSYAKQRQDEEGDGMPSDTGITERASAERGGAVRVVSAVLLDPIFLCPVYRREGRILDLG